MAFVCRIGATDYGPEGENALGWLRLAGGGWGEIGVSTIILYSEGAAYNVVDKQQVYIYETDGDGDVTHRWFGGFVSRVKTTVVRGTGIRVYLVQCQDWNLLLDRIVGRAATAHVIKVPADTFGAQIEYVTSQVQSGASLGINAADLVANLTALTALPGQIFRGMSLGEMIEAICAQAMRVDGSLRPRFFVGYDYTLGPDFGLPMLNVYDFAVAGAVASWTFGDSPGVGEYEILGTFTRDVDGTELVNWQQTYLANNGLVSTGSVAGSIAAHPNPYSGQNAWAAPPLLDRWSVGSTEAQAFADGLVAETAFPLEIVSFQTDQKVKPNQYVDVTMVDDGVVGERYLVLAVSWDFLNKNLPVLATLTLGDRRLGPDEKPARSAKADLRAAPVFHIRHFGALADGSADDGEAVQLAIDAADFAGGGTVELGPGSIKSNAQIVLSDKVHLRGHGQGSTYLDFSNISGLSAADPCIKAEGALGSAVGTLAADVALHDYQLVFTTDVGLAAGDVLLIYDNSNYSFSGARSYYRAGEYLRVFSYDAATKTAQLSSRTHAAYVRNVHGRIVITGAPTGGTYTLTYNGQTTTPLAHNATPATIQAALEALSSVGAGKVTCSSIGAQPDSPVNVVFDLSLTSTTFSGASSLTGGTSPTLNVQAGKVAVYKPATVTTSVRGTTLKYKYGQRGIKTVFGRGCSFRDLHMSGSEYSLIELDRSFECDVSSCVGTDTNSAAGSYRYGISIVNSQRVHVVNSVFETSRHGLVTGGGNWDGAIPVRELVIAGCTIGGNKNQEDDNGINGFNLHGNSERVVVSGCNFPNGMDICGDHVTVVGCDIRNGAGNGIYMTETLGFSYAFIGNRIQITHDHPDNFGFVYGQFKAQYTGRTGGTFRFVDNDVDYGSYANATGGQATAGLYLFNVSGPADNTVIIEGNRFYSSKTSHAAPHIGPWVRAFAGAGIREVIIRNNTCRGVGIRVEDTGSELVVFENNVVGNALDRGIMLQKPAGTPAYTKQVVVCRNNTVIKAKYNGIQLEGNSQTDTLMQVSDNLSINNNQANNSATLALETSIYVQYAERVYFEQNICGDNQASDTQNAWWAADHITNLYEFSTRNVGSIIANDERTNITNYYSGISSLSGTITGAQHGSQGGGSLHSNVVAGGAAGFMSGADKTKLDQVTIAASKIFTVSRTITLDAGGDGFTLTIPASGTVALLGVAQTITGQKTFDVTSGGVKIDGANAVSRDIAWYTSGSPRWIFRTTNTTESGGNAGSNFQINSRTDAGAVLATVMEFTRSTSKATFAGEIAAANLAITAGKVLTVARSIILDAASDGLTLTIPATGTAALLGSSQTFTAAQTFEGGAIFNDTGAAVDFRVESDNNANMLVVSGAGDAIGVGTAATPGIPLRVFKIVSDLASGATSVRGLEMGLQAYRTASAHTGDLTALYASAYVHGNNTQNNSNSQGFSGFNLDQRALAGAAGTITHTQGLYISFNNASSMVFTNYYGARFTEPQNTGAGSITSAAGVLIHDIDVAGTNNSNLVVGRTTIPTGRWSIYNDSTADNWFAGSIQLNNAVNLILGTGTGTKIGTGTSQKLGFWNATPITQPTVTGSRSGNAALASLLTALASAGLLVDSSTA